jgi:3-methylcrotonyl-CoA carboxylase alpha subunit
MKLLCPGEDEHDVEVRESAAGPVVIVDGKSLAVEVDEVAPGTFQAESGEHRETFHCVRKGEEVYLSWRGTAYRLEIGRSGGTAPRQALRGLEAPMPGKVIAVKASPGQAVAKGDEILVVEAMKMENAIRAPRDGKIKSIAVKLGDMVSPGVTLAELE